MLKNIIFDFGGVVCTFNQDDILHRFCTDAEHARLKPVLFRGWQELDEGALDYEEYAKETLSLLPESDHELVQRFFREWHHAMLPLPGMWALIGELKARGYRLYLLSNASTWFANHLDDFPILQLMDGKIISGPLKMHKPNNDIYRYALTRYDLNAAETIFIDDNPENAHAAEKIGLTGYAFDGDAVKLREFILSH